MQDNTGLATKAATQSDGLTVRDEFSNELAPTAAAAEKQYEIQGAMVLAKRFPRNEDAAFEKLMKACNRTSFAEDAEYSFPRGKVQDDNGKWVPNYVKGPSVNLAREAARIWGNIRYGLNIKTETEDMRHIQGWAYDLETNTRVEADDSFLKLIFRKNGGWQKPDERDLRELTNRRAAILIRNCILQLLPKDLIEDAIGATRSTLQAGAAQDPEGARKKIITAFSSINVSVAMLETYLGHELAQASPAQIAELRTIYKSIADGNSKWAEYVNGNGHTDAEELKNKTEANAAALKDKLTKPNIVDETGPDVTVADAQAAEPEAKTPEEGASVDEPRSEESQLADLLLAIEEKLAEMPDKGKKVLNGRKVATMDLKALNGLMNELGF